MRSAGLLILLCSVFASYERIVGSCPTGYTGTYCEYACPETCVACVSASQCTSCKPGYYGYTCTDRCSDICTSGNCYIDGTCTDNGHNQCSPTCQKCVKRTCTECKSGYYGHNCTNTCVNCLSYTACNKANGTCDTCMTGFSGPECTDQCLLNCESCHRDLFTTCLTCPTGKYGNVCNLSCPSNCVNHSCDIDTGDCDSGCNSALYYGPSCSTPCPRNCNNSECHRNGVCKGCQLGFCEKNCSQVCSGNDANCSRFGKHTDHKLICNKCKDGFCVNETGSCTEILGTQLYNSTCIIMGKTCKITCMNVKLDNVTCNHVEPCYNRPTKTVKEEMWSNTASVAASSAVGGVGVTLLSVLTAYCICKRARREKPPKNHGSETRHVACETRNVACETTNFACETTNVEAQNQYESLEEPYYRNVLEEDSNYTALNDTVRIDAPIRLETVQELH